MPFKRYLQLQYLGLTMLLVGVTLIAGCSSNASESSTSAGLRTWWLVGEPTTPLPVGQPIEVRSRSEDGEHGISHVELYLVQFQPQNGPTVTDRVLIRSDAAPFSQTGFTASQIFTPKQPGRYTISVKAFNSIGNSVEAGTTINFDVQ